MMAKLSRQDLLQGLYIAALAIGFTMLLVELGIWIPVNLSRSDIKATDAIVYYNAALRVRTGRPLYRPWPGYGPDLVPNRADYPPVLYRVLAPLSRLTPTLFLHVLYVLALCESWCYACCLAWLARGKLTVDGFLIANGALFLCPGAMTALGFANVEPLMWAVLGLALALPLGRGVAFAIGALIKLHTGWPLLLASWIEGKKIWLPAIVVLIAGVLIGASTSQGFAAWRHWVAYGLPPAAQGTFQSDNISLSFAGLRLARLLGWQYHGGPLTLVPRMYLIFMELAGPLATIVLLRRRSPELLYAAAVCATVFFAPLCWATYTAYLLAVVACVLAEVRHKRQPPRPEALDLVPASGAHPE